ncbi:hypothetical protein BGZ54_008422 [Gamsiella multidivaricata]|nr:hypothetical protein BGZ54_008422 [Gamsiella multidivaricata]
MRPQNSVAVLLLLLFSCLAVTAPVLATKTVVDLISSDPGFSRLVKELQRLRLIVLLNRRKTCTFFAPTNAAFDRWDAEHSGRRMDQATLLYHILPDNTLTDNLRDAMLLETLLVREGYLVETMKKHDELSAIYNIVHSAGLTDLLRQHRPFTLFAPIADGLKKLSDIQVHYLRHEQGRKDLETTFHHHIHAGTLYKQDIRPGTSSVSTLEGQDLMISLDDKLLVDNAEVETTDILASNGVIHTVSRPLLPSALVWTAAKYLVGLNATNFVNALRDSGLNHYIDDPAASYTIFAPQDDTFPDEFSNAFHMSREVLQYHVVPGRNLYTSFRDGQLLSTELHTERLNGDAQRSKVQVRQDNKHTVVSINGVELKGEPVQIGRSIIYLVSRPLGLPLPLIKQIKKEASLSEFTHVLTATGLDRRLSDARGITVFAPASPAWDELGVVKNYLMLEGNSSVAALEAVARYTIVENTHYTPDIKPGRTLLPTSEGSNLVIEKNGGTIYVGEGRLERSEQVGGKITGKDLLVDSGVIHTVSSVALPPTLSITLYNVLQGAGTADFLQAFQTSNITRILTNWEQDFTIFAPTDEAFKKAGLEAALSDREFVARLVRLHVIPGKVLKLEEDINDDEASMLNDEARLSYRDIHHDGKTFGVRVKGARSTKEARIIGGGRAHPAWPDESLYRNKRPGSGMQQQQAVENGGVHSIGSTVSAAQAGGVVYVIDRVLLPGDPDGLSAAWFWIGIVVLGLLGTTVLCALTALSIFALVKEIRHLEGYQAVATDEESQNVNGDDVQRSVGVGAAQAEPVADVAASGDTLAAEAAQANIEGAGSERGNTGNNNRN